MLLKTAFSIFTLILLMTIPAIPAKCLNTPNFVSSSEQHVAKLNSPMPYIAGFHVDSDNLTLREVVDATAVTVSFGATDPHFFPIDSWIGGGMFVQAQDTIFKNVDYGFYMMLTIDSSSRQFVDVGLHQTEEATAPNHTPRSNLVFSFSWQILGANLSDQFTLEQRWIDRDLVRYSVSNSNKNITLATINVRSFPNCQNIIPKFYAGNVIIDPFPLSRYINYFQFGVVSNRIIADSHWQVKIEQPRMLRETGWTPVKKAWLLQGSYSYLDHDLMWGGTDYHGVDVTHQPYSDNPYIIIFQYSGRTSSETVLWDISDTGQTPHFGSESMELTMQARRFMPPGLLLLGITLIMFLFAVRKKRQTNEKRALRNRRTLTIFQQFSLRSSVFWGIHILTVSGYQ
jgi:hypothetical protein